MKPITFKEHNVVYAKNQPPYLPLPVYRNEDGDVTSCWKLSFLERIRILFCGKFFITMLTFNAPLQPLRPSTTFNIGE